jgi:hypothetical protein
MLLRHVEGALAGERIGRSPTLDTNRLHVTIAIHLYASIISSARTELVADYLPCYGVDGPFRSDVALPAQRPAPYGYPFSLDRVTSYMTTESPITFRSPSSSMVVVHWTWIRSPRLVSAGASSKASS